MRSLIALFVVFSAFGLAIPASAATTVYTDSSNYSAWSNVSDPFESVGAANGSGASMGYGSWIAYQTDMFTTVDMTLEFLGAVGSGSIYFYVGTTNGNGWFSNLNYITTNVTTGSNQITSTTLTNYCVSIGGCNSFIVQSLSGTTLTLDSAGMTGEFVAPNPEPSTWFLMITGFVLLAARLRQLRWGTKEARDRHPVLQPALA